MCKYFDLASFLFLIFQPQTFENVIYDGMTVWILWDCPESKFNHNFSKCERYYAFYFSWLVVNRSMLIGNNLSPAVI